MRTSNYQYLKSILNMHFCYAGKYRREHMVHGDDCFMCHGTNLVHVDDLLLRLVTYHKNAMKTVQPVNLKD